MTWALLIAAVALWWFWPQLARTTTGQTAPSVDIERLGPPSATQSIEAWQIVRNRLLAVGASEDELGELYKLTPALMRPTSQEV